MKDKDVNSRYLIIMHGIKTGNVSETCKLFGVSRTTYYKWYERYKECGVEGLKDKERAKPKMPNEISKEVENTILELVIQNPKDGPRRLSYDLNDIGIDISETGVYNALKRNGLNIAEERIKYSKKNNYSSSPKKIKKKLPNYKNIEKYYPGYVLQLGTSYIGKLNNIGKVYMISIVDCYSKFSAAKVYGNKSFENVKDLLETKLIPIMKSFHIDIENIITNGSREYTTNWENGEHKFDGLLEKYNTKHYIIPANHEDEPKCLQELNDTLHDEFYKEVLKDNRYNTIDELQGDLQLYMTYYNLEKKIDRGKNMGKSPLQGLIGEYNLNGPMPIWFFVNTSNFREG
ncbi:helix-turn-helix domain-containing protein [Sporanaerobacter acetigenes]|uniref:helix-turn-helix domain-containing protein n=1 Tax=Sporanaerobacter acetigenes TaxID=165813 RepID=UPI003322E6CA